MQCSITASISGLSLSLSLSCQNASVFLGELLRLHRGSMDIRKKALFCREWPERSCGEFSSLWADWKYNHSQKCVCTRSECWMNKRMKNREKTRGKEWTRGLMRLDRTTSLSLAAWQHDLSDTRAHGDDGERRNYKRKKTYSSAPKPMQLVMGACETLLHEHLHVSKKWFRTWVIAFRDLVLRLFWWYNKPYQLKKTLYQAKE